MELSYPVNMTQEKRVNINLEVICGYLAMYSHTIVINIQNKL